MGRRCLCEKQVARTADFAVRVFSVAIIATGPYSIAVSKLRCPFLSDRYFFIVVRLLRRREKFTEPDFALLARAFNRARPRHPSYLSLRPGEGRFGQPPRRLVPPCGIKLQRIRRHERRRIRQPTDRNSGVLFFATDISLSPCACSGGERSSPSLISPCWHEPSTERT